MDLNSQQCSNLRAMKVIRNSYKEIPYKWLKLLFVTTLESFCPAGLICTCHSYIVSATALDYLYTPENNTSGRGKQHTQELMKRHTYVNLCIPLTKYHSFWISFQPSRIMDGGPALKDRKIVKHATLT